MQTTKKQFEKQLVVVKRRMKEENIKHYKMNQVSRQEK